MELIFSKTFQKEAKKITQNKPKLKAHINECLIDFAVHGRQATCYRKKLKGRLKPLEELEVGGDIRIFIEIDESNSIAVLERIGTHAQLNI